MNNAEKIKNYREKGYFICNVNKKKIINLRKKFIKTFDLISSLILKKKIKNDKDIIKLYKSKNRKLWVGAYDSIKFHPDLFYFSGLKEFKKITQIAGIKNPCHGQRPLVRVDMPKDKKFAFKSHQDYPFNMGSVNSVTIWMPLQDTNIKMGTLKIAEKSHLPKKILKYALDGKNYKINFAEAVLNKKNIKSNKKNTYTMSVDDKKYQYSDINLKAGQALVFSQFLVHKSGLNNSNKIRFSVQLRFNDLGAYDYAKRNYFMWVR